MQVSQSPPHLCLGAVRLHHLVFHVLAKVSRKVLQRAALAILQADKDRQLPAHSRSALQSCATEQKPGADICHRSPTPEPLPQRSTRNSRSVNAIRGLLRDIGALEPHHAGVRRQALGHLAHRCQHVEGSCSNDSRNATAPGTGLELRRTTGAVPLAIVSRESTRRHPSLNQHGRTLISVTTCSASSSLKAETAQI